MSEEWVVMGGRQGECYHHKIGIRSKHTGHTRVGTACGRDSAIYGLIVVPKAWVLESGLYRPCKICYPCDYAKEDN